MSTIDLDRFPYSLYINTSREWPWHSKCDCICKDILTESLNNLLSITNYNKYACYLTGKINSSSPYPTFDCDLILTNSVYNEEELYQLIKDIKFKGFESDINFDVKYMENIEPFSSAVDTPDEVYQMSQTLIQYDLSQNEFTNLITRTDPVKIRKTRNKEFTYYKPLLLKNENSTTYIQSSLNYLNDSLLPVSNEKNSKFQHTLPFKII